MYAWTLPLWWLRVEIRKMSSKVVKHPIKKRTIWSIVLPWLILPLVRNKISENTSLSSFSSSFTLFPLNKRIIVETIAINIIRIDLISILQISKFEIPTTSRSRINQTRTSIIRQQLRINKIMINDKLNLVLLEMTTLKIHHTVAHQYTPQINLTTRTLVIMLVYQFSKIWNVLSCVWFTS